MYRVIVSLFDSHTSYSPTARRRTGVRAVSVFAFSSRGLVRREKPANPIAADTRHRRRRLIRRAPRSRITHNNCTQRSRIHDDERSLCKLTRTTRFSQQLLLNGFGTDVLDRRRSTDRDGGEFVFFFVFNLSYRLAFFTVSICNRIFPKRPRRHAHVRVIVRCSVVHTAALSRVSRRFIVIWLPEPIGLDARASVIQFFEKNNIS